MGKEVVSPLRQRMIEDMNARKLREALAERPHPQLQAFCCFFRSARPRPPRRMTSAGSSCT